MAKKEKIQKMFDNIAGDYDKLNHIMSLDIDRSWRKKAVKTIVDTKTPMKILDVACGTGDFSIAIARAAGPGSRIIGADLSDGMLEVGRKKISAAGMSDKIVMEQGDCENLRFAECSFDRVTVAFGVRNFEHLDLGLKEMLRVLKPGGKVVILELSLPENPVVASLFKLYFLHILPRIGGTVSGDKKAYEYLPASVLKFPKQQIFKQMMSDCGFSSVYAKAFTFGICRMYVGTK